MDIIWHGHSCFTIKGKDASIVTNPYAGLGDQLPKLKANLVTLGDEYAEKQGEIAEVDGDPKVLDWPGEFEVAGVTIEAFSGHRYAKDMEGEEDNVNIFVFNIDNIKVCHLSGLAHELSDELLDHIGDVDILLLPVGGKIVLDGKTAQKVFESIEPRVVIPMYFANNGTKLNLEGPEAFLKAVGQSNLAAENKFTVSKRSDLPEGQTQFVLLEAQH